MKIVVFGLSITSSWGNGHATTYRCLVNGLARRGHEVAFFERDVPWYAAHRDLGALEGARVALYPALDALAGEARTAVRAADLVIVGSYVPDGVAVARWVLEHAACPVAFYDIDTPVTLAKLERGDEEYLSRELVRRFDLYLSFTGGPLLDELETTWGARRAAALYCAADPERHAPREVAERWALGYLGTYGEDRQPAVERLLCAVARALPHERFVVAGPQYPPGIDWPANVERIEHLPPAAHPDFYGAQRLTLNVTRADMRRRGWAPSVRLFEAAACGVPVLSDVWPGLDDLFEPGREILLADSTEEALAALRGRSAAELRAIGAAARARVLAAHTGVHRAIEIETLVAELDAGRAPRRAGGES